MRRVLALYHNGELTLVTDLVLHQDDSEPILFREEVGARFGHSPGHRNDNRDLLLGLHTNFSEG